MSSQIHHNEAFEYSSNYFLDRPRIDLLLERAFQKPLTVVVAGGGYGKTRTVSSALESMRMKYAWLQLFEIDNTIDILWNRLIYAIERHSPTLVKAMRSLGYPNSPASFFQLLRLIEAELQNKDRFVMVVDDFHSLQDKTGSMFFENLITANIPNLSIVLISRENPRLPLARMLSSGLLAKITEDDLRFSQDEMEDYFRMQGETLGTGLSSSLYAFTEGWILAISLVGLSMKRGSVYNQNQIMHAKINIFELIEEEIYQYTSKELKKFLAIFALLDAPPIGLLNELSMGTPEFLSEINNRQLLIRYDAHTKCYRMHNLFKDFLSGKKNLLTHAEIENVHLTAAQWYKVNHSLEEAINHYSKCGCYAEIFDIILSFSGHLTRDIMNLFVLLIERAPSEILKAKPIMQVVKAKFLFNNNQIQEAEDTLTIIREEYEALPPKQEHFAILGEVYILLSLISIVKQNFNFVAFFKKADQLLPSGSVLIDNRLNIAEGINITGIKNPMAGELTRYQDALFEAAPYANKVMNGCGYGMEYLNAADAAFMTGNMKHAEKYAYETIYRAQQQQQHGIQFMANFYLIRISVYKGDHAKITLILKQMKEQSQQLQNADCMTLYDIIEGWFFVKIGCLDQVAKWILREEETRKILAPVILGREYLVRSDYLLAESKYYELLGFMKHSDTIYAQRGILYALIQNKITESIIYHYLGEHDDSMDALQSAYNLSHANNLVIQYIEYGSKMRTVAKAAIRDKDCKIPLPWLQNILTKSSTYAKRLAYVTEGYNTAGMEDKQSQVSLSKREMEVLSCIMQGLTRDEIADTCNLSLNTVKSIQKSIFNKLGVTNSMDAVRIAMTMGLI